jgi:hypothetical protein
MSYSFSGHFTEKKPSIVKDFQRSNCICAFCQLAFGFDPADLTEQDRKTIRVHLEKSHGWIPDEALKA